MNAIVRDLDSAEKIVRPDDGSRSQMTRVCVIAESVVAGEIDNPVVVSGVAVCISQSAKASI